MANITKKETGQDAGSIARALADPFPADAIGWKPQTVSGNRCLAVAYIDARDVMDRLDDVMGPAGWQDNYQFLPSGLVLCTLRLHLGDDWIEKSDVGGESEQKDQGDRQKAAVSDALKRAAVKFGIGRYIYRLDHQWVDFDPKTKRIAKPPRLPAWALPGTKERPPVVPPQIEPEHHPAHEAPAQQVAEDVARQTNGRVMDPATPRPMGVTPTAKISKAQLQLIEGLLKRTGVDAARFCQAHKIMTITDLTQAEFAIALGKLESRERRMAEEARQAEEDPDGVAEREAIEAEA